jgi:TolB-like protein
LNKKLSSRYFVAVAILFIIIGTSSVITIAADPQVVALLPFKINAEKDLTYLQNGIFDMLSSRLTDPGKVMVLSRAEIDKALAGTAGPQDEIAARSFGETLGADHLLFGSLTKFGESFSIDAKMVDVSGATPTTAVFEQSPDAEGIIPSIDRFATNINAQIFGRGQPKKTMVTAPAPSDPQEAMQDERTAHPEKLYRKDDTQQVSPFITRKELVLQSPNMWKSPNFKYLVNGMSVGDADGDGRLEVVVVSPDTIYIYRYQEKRFIEIARQKTGSNRNNIGVDLADLNGNGKAEIFVTAVNNRRVQLLSHVHEFDGKAFVEIDKGLSWYFRQSDVPVRGRILLGQQSVMNEPYRGKIFEMQWDGGAYVPQTPVSTPSRTRINVLGAAMGDVQNSGEEILVAFDKFNRIVMTAPTGARLWRSGEKYGGSSLFINDMVDQVGDISNPIYLPMRILVRNRAPADDESRSQVIAVRNKELMGMHWERREFTSVHIEAFAWDGVGLSPVWATRKMDGFIRDIQVADFDADGRDELLIGLVTKSGELMLTTPNSTLIAYELDAVSAGPQVSGQ